MKIADKVRQSLRDSERRFENIDSLKKALQKINELESTGVIPAKRTYSFPPTDTLGKRVRRSMVTTKE